MRTETRGTEDLSDAFDELFDIIERDKAIERAVAGLTILPADRIVAALAAGHGVAGDDFETRLAVLVSAGHIDEEQAAVFRAMADEDAVSGKT